MSNEQNLWGPGEDQRPTTSQRKQKLAVPKSPPDTSRDFAAGMVATTNVIFTAALVAIGYLQWETSKKATALSYALANPRFEVSMAQTPGGVNPYDGATVLRIRPVNGVYAVRYVDVTQNFDVLFSEGEKSVRCELALTDFFSAAESYLDFRTTRLADRFEDAVAMNKAAPDGVRIIPLPAGTEIDATFDDIFRERKRQKFAWTKGLVFPISDDSPRSRPRASLGKDSKGRPILNWEDPEKASSECKAVAAGLAKYGPPEVIRYQSHRAVRNYVDANGEHVTEITTWRTPIVEP